MKLIIILFLLSTSVKAQMRARHQLGFYELVSLNQIGGARALHKFGANEDVSIGTDEDCWESGGLYVFPSAPAVISIASASANDTGAGSGARTLKIEGLDANYSEITETVTMNGTAPVVTTKSFLRVNRAYNVLAGSNNANAGIITLTLSGVIVATIDANEGQTQIGIYTVPAGHKLLLYRLTGGLGKKTGTAGQVHFMSRLSGGAWRVDQVLTLGSQTIERTAVFPYVITEKSDVKVTIRDISSNNTGAVCGFDGVLLNDNTFQGI